MRNLVLMLTLAGITLHASFGCWVFHVHAHESEGCVETFEVTHHHGEHDVEAEMPCEEETPAQDGCDEVPCVFANGVKVDVSTLLLTLITPFFEPSAPTSPRITIAPRFERASFRLSSPLRSHLQLGVLLL
jgi:hypothetical protein